MDKKQLSESDICDKFIRPTMGSGMTQAINYAELLGVPFCFASNGDGFVFRDATLADGVLEKNLSLVEFPSPNNPELSAESTNSAAFAPNCASACLSHKKANRNLPKFWWSTNPPPPF